MVVLLSFTGNHNIAGKQVDDNPEIALLCTKVAPSFPEGGHPLPPERPQVTHKLH